MCINKLEAMSKRLKLNLAQLLFILLHDSSYIAFTLFTHIKFTHMWKSTLSLIFTSNKVRIGVCGLSKE